MHETSMVSPSAEQRTDKDCLASARNFTAVGAAASMVAYLPVRKGDGKPLSRARHGV